MDKIVVESQALFTEAIKSHKFNGEQLFLADDSWTRVCAPSPDCDRMAAVILWTKDDEHDVTPTWDKVVSSTCQLPIIIDETNTQLP
jgi:hypothetical protein